MKYLQDTENQQNIGVLAQYNFESIEARLWSCTPSVQNNAVTTDAGPPTTGDWEVGELWWDVNLATWRCTVAGTPGTWIQVSPAIFAAIGDLPATPPDGYRAQVGAKSFVYDQAEVQWIAPLGRDDGNGLHVMEPLWFGNGITGISYSDVVGGLELGQGVWALPYSLRLGDDVIYVSMAIEDDGAAYLNIPHRAKPTKHASSISDQTPAAGGNELNGSVGHIRLTGAPGVFSVDGVSNGFSGDEVTIVNADAAYQMTLSHESASVTDWKRIVCPGSVDLACRVATLIYLQAEQRWYVKSFTT